MQITTTGSQIIFILFSLYVTPSNQKPSYQVPQLLCSRASIVLNELPFVSCAVYTVQSSYNAMFGFNRNGQCYK